MTDKKLKILYLNVDNEYYSEWLNNEKGEEFREAKLYWKQKLENRKYDLIKYISGYPKKDNFSKQAFLPYRGFKKKTIYHRKFKRELEVYAIKLIHPHLVSYAQSMDLKDITEGFELTFNKKVLGEVTLDEIKNIQQGYKMYDR